MFYPEELIEEVRMKNDIVDVISGYVKLQKKGSSHFGLCPFHNEKSPSFSVSGSKQMYYCFGCGAGGNVFTFIMEYENFSFHEAVKFLADRAGVSLPTQEYSEEMKKKESKRARLLEVNKEAAKYFYYQLRSDRGAVGYKYLRSRQLSDETIKKFGLGFANVTSNDLVKYLKSKGYDDKLIQEAGLASFDEKYGMHDKFWNRVMFPIQDSNHRVIGFGGRVMGDAKPKYLNSPETMIFDKSRNLYGLNFARSSRKNQFILCEGYMDVIALHQAGFTQAVASLGTAFTAGQANLLRRYTENVLLSSMFAVFVLSLACKTQEIFIPESRRRRIFFAVQGGFQICEAPRTCGTQASEFENNAVMRKKDKSYMDSVKIWYAGAPSQSAGISTPNSTAAVGARSTSRI